MNNNTEKYKLLIDKVVKQFWNTRNRQLKGQGSRNIKDAGNRGAVTGGHS